VALPCLMSLRSSARSLIAVASIALIAGLGGCHKSGATTSASDSTALPAASTLIAQAATAMGTVQTVAFALTVDGTLQGVPVSNANGVLTHAGDAKGSATVSLYGTTVQAEFVIVDGSFYLKAITGGFQKLPLSSATQVYDPSAILDPNRGISKLLTASTNTKTVAETTIDGKAAYQVQLTPDPAAVQSLIPGAGSGTTGSIWIDKATGHVVKAVFAVPSGGKTATVTITLTNYDAPVTISAP
jgi:lipoprotein LprG